MPASQPSYPSPSEGPNAVLKENGIESCFIGRLQGLKYNYRPDITDRAALEQNFREKFEALNRCKLTDAEFARLLDEIVTADVFAAAKTLRRINSFTRVTMQPRWTTPGGREKAEGKRRNGFHFFIHHSNFPLFAARAGPWSRSPHPRMIPGKRTRLTH